jgi:hypothetical protein
VSSPLGVSPGEHATRPLPGRSTRLVSYLRWQPDKWERLNVLAGLVGSARSVLDVGGRGKELASLLPGLDVSSANVRPPADFLITAGRLPFADGTFDVVTSSDVLEHIPGDERELHIQELARVARSRIVVGCPLGSPDHEASEQQLSNTLRERFGLRLDFLEEHLEFGLPTLEEVQGLLARAAPGAPIDLRYHSDFRKGCQMLLDGVAARWNHDPRALVRLIRDFYLAPRTTELAVRSTPTTNRLYAIVDLQTGSA